MTTEKPHWGYLRKSQKSPSAKLAFALLILYHWGLGFKFWSPFKCPLLKCKCTWKESYFLSIKNRKSQEWVIRESSRTHYQKQQVHKCLPLSHGHEQRGAVNTKTKEWDLVSYNPADKYFAATNKLNSIFTLNSCSNAHESSFLVCPLLWIHLLSQHRAGTFLRGLGQSGNMAILIVEFRIRFPGFSKASMGWKGRLSHFQILHSQNHGKWKALWVLTLMAEKWFLAIEYNILSLEVI